MNPIDCDTYIATFSGMTEILAQAKGGGDFGDASKGLGNVIKFMNVLGIVLAFGGLLFAAAMFIMGQTDKVIFGVIGAAIGGLAWVIVKTFFKLSGDVGDVDDMFKMIPLLPFGIRWAQAKAQQCRFQLQSEASKADNL